MKLSQLVDQLRKELGLDRAISVDSSGAYTIYMEQNVFFRLTDLNPGFSLFCQVAPLPKGKQEQFYTQMMLANLFGQGTEGAVLGLSEDGKVLILSKEIHYTLECDRLKEELEDFMNAIDFWREEAIHFKAA